MKTTKLFLVLLIMSISYGSLMAQKKGDNEKFNSAVNDYVNKLAVDIQLTDSQKISLKKAVFEYYSSLTEQKANNRTTKQSELELIEQKFNVQKESILTTTQKEAIIINESRRGNEASTKNTNKQSK